jgi:hypothetical protein
LQCYALVRIQERDLRVWNHRAGRVLNDTAYRALVHLAKCDLAADEEEAQTRKGDGADPANPADGVAIMAHPNTLPSASFPTF